jgi:hypothetical protein
VLGISQPEWADEETGTITESWVIVNSQLRWVGDDQLQNFRAVFTHEFGHAINLAHSQTNGAIQQYADSKGPLSCGTTLPYSTAITLNDRETMYPFLNVRPTTGNGLQMSTVNVSDDKTSVSNLYPAPGYPDTRGSITGRILKSDGTTGVTGVNVIARNLDNPYADAISAMSGDYVRVAENNDGSFTINGLTPGARYALYNDVIVQGGFPTKQPDYLPEGEEFFNGENESGNGITDSPCQMTPIVATAGSVTQADITLNTVQGAPKFTPLVGGMVLNSISSDGNIIAGAPASGGGTYRYTEADGHQLLNDTSGSFFSTMSRDGSFFSSETMNSANKRVASILQYPGGSWQQLPVPQVALPAVATPSDYVTTHMELPNMDALLQAVWRWTPMDRFPARSEGFVRSSGHLRTAAGNCRFLPVRGMPSRTTSPPTVRPCWVGTIFPPPVRLVMERAGSTANSYPSPLRQCTSERRTFRRQMALSFLAGMPVPGLKHGIGHRKKASSFLVGSER